MRADPIVLVSTSTHVRRVALARGGVSRAPLIRLGGSFARVVKRVVSVAFDDTVHVHHGVSRARLLGASRRAQTGTVPMLKTMATFCRVDARRVAAR